MTMEKVRKVKVYSEYRRRTFDSTFVAQIRLSGRWLEKLGFRKGRRIIIAPEQNKLTIYVLNT